jgi:hypothetical protein
MNYTPSQIVEMVSGPVMAAVAGWPAPLPAVVGALIEPALALAPAAVIWTVLILTTLRSDRRWWARHEAKVREQARLREIRDRLWLESLPPDRREAVLQTRREEADHERRAREILRQEMGGGSS